MTHIQNWQQKDKEGHAKDIIKASKSDNEEPIKIPKTLAINQCQH